MVRDYEVMYIVRPDLDDEGLTAAMESVETTVVGQGGEVVRTTPWGKRRLAYEIDRMRDGNYVLLHVRLDGARVKEVERLLHINDNVVRHLVTLWVDTRGKEEEDGAEGQVRERGAARGAAPEGNGDAADGGGAAGGDVTAAVAESSSDDGSDAGDGDDDSTSDDDSTAGDDEDDATTADDGDGATTGEGEDEEDE